MRLQTRIGAIFWVIFCGAAQFRVHGQQQQLQKSRFLVYRTRPATVGQVQFLHNLRLKNTKLDFWKEASRIGEQAHVMVVSGDDERWFLDALSAQNLTYSMMIDDVERKIVEQKRKSEQQTHWNSSYGLRLHDAPFSGNRIGFALNRYHSFTDVIGYLNALAVTYPDRVRVMPIGITHEGRQIPMIQIGRPSSSGAIKPGIWIDGGIHAREWIAPAVVLYMIHELAEKYDIDAQIRNFVDNIDWFIVPLLNPDGYEYSRSSTHPDIRLWRKNRSPSVCIQIRQNPFSFAETRCCQGVDLNRNFDWDFGVEGSSTDPCSEIYQGAYAFSEPETRAVRDFVAERQHRIRAFLTFHSYSQILMYPFGHQVRTYTNDVHDLRNTALHAASALRSLYGTTYVVGTGADTLYPASGGSEDWARGRMGIKYSYLFELRPEEDVWDGFLLAENQIIPTSRETFEAVKVIASQTFDASTSSSSSSSSSVRRAPQSFAKSRKKMLCVDHDPSCELWSRRGACQSQWTAWMRANCPRSCGLCQQRQRIRIFPHTAVTTSR